MTRRALFLTLLFYGCAENPSQNKDNIAANSIQETYNYKEDNSSDVKQAETTISEIINECPDGQCYAGMCKTSGFIGFLEFESLCTKPCVGDEYGQGNYSDEELDQMMCGNFTNAICCGNISLSDSEISYWCIPKEHCCRPPKPIVCDNGCCSEGEKCNPDTKACEPKCAPPAPNVCANKCCPNNHTCECEDFGGFCLPEGAQMCDCEHKLWCEPLQECNFTCLEFGYFCKPLGAEDCIEAENCYCDPGDICTHSKPACCPSDTPVPCGEYCCPKNSECLPEIDDCLAPGWEYCSQWKIKCPPGKECMKKQKGCKNDGETECDDDAICPVNQTCVGMGNGIASLGCCPNNNPTPCNGYCCPSGTHCDAGCGGCVEDGYKCCGTKVCLDKKICWSGGSACLDSIDQDCGSYYCDSEYVCYLNVKGCCPASAPNGCGSNNCCKGSDTCYIYGDDLGVCVPVGAGYCGEGYICNSGSNTECCGGWSGVCIDPQNDECCPPTSSKNKYWGCGSGEECCGDYCISAGYTCCGNFGNAGKAYYCPPTYECFGDSADLWACVPPLGTACVYPECDPGIYKFLCPPIEKIFACGPGKECCEKHCMTQGNICCGDGACFPQNKCVYWPNGQVACCSPEYPKPCVIDGVNKCCS